MSFLPISAMCFVWDWHQCPAPVVELKLTSIPYLHSPGHSDWLRGDMWLRQDQSEWTSGLPPGKDAPCPFSPTVHVNSWDTGSHPGRMRVRLRVGESGQQWRQAELGNGEKKTKSWSHYLSPWIKHCLKLELPLDLSVTQTNKFPLYLNQVEGLIICWCYLQLRNMLISNSALSPPSLEASA